MKKFWALVCVIGFTAFWAYALAMAAALFGAHIFSPIELIFCLSGAALGLFARAKVTQSTPSMHGQRAAARARLDNEYMESAQG